MTTALGIYRPPFEITPEVRTFPINCSVSEMVDRFADVLPHDFRCSGRVLVRGQEIPRETWHLVRPRAARTITDPVDVTFWATPQGGGGDQGGGKNVLALVASIGLTAATGFIAGGGLATSSGLFAKGTLSATALAAGVSLAGSLLIGAFVAPPSPSEADDVRRGDASAEGNALNPNAALPRVVGTHKVFPPLAAEPLIYFDGEDEVVEAVYALAGPHSLDDIRVANAPIADVTDLTYEVRSGWPGDAPLELVTRQSRTEALRTELRGHTVASSDGTTLESTSGDTASALPQVTTVATRDEPDEAWLHLAWPQGLHRKASETDLIRVPFRIRIRLAGETTWTVLPELHFQAANVRQRRATVRLIWTDDATVTPGAATGEGWVEARRVSPAQTVAPTGASRVADTYFDDGSGDEYLDANNVGSTSVDHVILGRYEAAIYLDTATFPKGRYEVEIQRGYGFREANYTASTYALGGSVRDPFASENTGAPEIYQTRDGMSDDVYLLRSVSVWDEHPVPSDDMALIAIQARNRRVEKVSAVASGYVRDWDGSAWVDWVTTSNPAPHLRDIFVGAQNMDPVPSEILDDAGLVSWRAACAALDYTCDAVIEGVSVAEATRIVASCGYARPYMAEVWGVVRDYDRSAEDPVQIFSPRNMAGFSWQKAFARVPDGFRVTYNDADRDYDARQITVFKAGSSDDSGLTEQITYQGITEETKARAKAAYDQAQAQARSTFFRLDAPAEAIVCRRGSLVGVQHDMLSQHAATGRIVAVEFSGSDVSAITLDMAVPVLNEPDLSGEDLVNVENLALAGANSGVALRRAGGSVTTHEIDGATGTRARLAFASPISATGLADGALAIVGRLGREMRRLIVFSIEPREDLTASLTLVDEAPELWSA